VGDLRFPDTLPEKLTRLIEYYQRSFPLEVNINEEIEAYKAFAHKLQVRAINVMEVNGPVIPEARTDPWHRGTRQQPAAHDRGQRALYQQGLR
jgi:hypothetical protein